MRLKLLVLSVVALLLNANVGSQELSVDEIIALHVDAIGGYTAIKSLQNLVYSAGTYREEGYTSNGDATMSLARPYFKLVGNKQAPGNYMEGYDGAAWEWFADPGVVVHTVGPPSAAIRHYAGVESPLVDYKQKGSLARLLGNAVFDEKAVHVVRLTRLDSYVEQFYIDADTHLILATGGEAPIHAFGESVARLTRRSDYRPVAGVLIPHAFTTVRLPAGTTLSTMRWGRVAANQSLPEGWFSAPELKRTPLQRFIEQLYEQRADLHSVMWTYRHFRRAHLNLDTDSAVGFAGFQMLKMGEVDNAIALLEQNVIDHPQSAAAHFQLGRALATAGHSAAAQEELGAALVIDPEFDDAREALLSLTER